MPTLALRTLLLAPEVIAVDGVRVTNVLSDSAGRVQSGESRRAVERDCGRGHLPELVPERRRHAR